MKITKQEAEELLANYFSGELPDNEQKMIEEWRKESPENEKYILEMQNGWEAMPLLHEMEKFNSFDALKKVSSRIELYAPKRWLVYLQRAAAVLIIPILIYSAYISVLNLGLTKLISERSIMQTVSTRQGMTTQFSLNDGTKVWLNAGSTLEFPVMFKDKKREVKLTGEAYFEVVKNEKQPFRVHAHDLDVEVLGTSFNVISYNDEDLSEVVLVEGKVKLSAESENALKQYGTMHPGQKAVYSKKNQKVESEEVEVDKYITWRQGSLIFRDDPMSEVVKRLSRWFNVEIRISDPELNSYVYKATFRNETLQQVLNLLKISAPIDYKIEDRKPLSNGEYTKQKIFLMKRKK